jgi:hypothetical protein
MLSVNLGFPARAVELCAYLPLHFILYRYPSALHCIGLAPFGYHFSSRKYRRSKIDGAVEAPEAGRITVYLYELSHIGKFLRREMVSATGN